MISSIRLATSTLRAALIFIQVAAILLATLDHAAAETRLEFEEISPGIYLHVGRHEDMSTANLGDIANIGFIVGNDSVAVIDPGGSPQIGAAMRKAIRETTDLPVSHVILTHGHPDHIFGGSAFADVERVVAHRNFTRWLVQRGDFYRQRYAGLFGDSDTPLTLRPTLEVDGLLRIDLGGRLLEVRAHRSAHTDNDLSIFDTRSGVLWASDLLFSERIPSLDGSLRGWLEVMDELANLPSTLVVPGHGRPGPWKTISEPQQRYLNALLRETRNFVARNRRLSEAVDTVAAAEAEKWLLAEIHHPGNVARAYAELEWE